MNRGRDSDQILKALARFHLPSNSIRKKSDWLRASDTGAAVIALAAEHPRGTHFVK